MTDDPAALVHIDGLDEPRRSQMRHLYDVIHAAIPDADIGVWDYAGPLIGFGSYAYSNSKGPAGRWFSVGLANRKGYISLYSMATSGGRYLVEAWGDRFPGIPSGKSCLNVRRPEDLDDDAVRDLARASWDQYKGGFQRP